MNIQIIIIVILAIVVILGIIFKIKTKCAINHQDSMTLSDNEHNITQEYSKQEFNTNKYKDKIEHSASYIIVMVFIIFFITVGSLGFSIVKMSSDVSNIFSDISKTAHKTINIDSKSLEEIQEKESNENITTNEVATSKTSRISEGDIYYYKDLEELLSLWIDKGEDYDISIITDDTINRNNVFMSYSWNKKTEKADIPYPIESYNSDVEYLEDLYNDNGIDCYYCMYFFDMEGDKNAYLFGRNSKKKDKLKYTSTILYNVIYKFFDEYNYGVMYNSENGLLVKDTGEIYYETVD